jgi:SAM-dependent methyltransferase
MSYEQLARYYDLVHAELTADIGFILTQAARARGPILELGCGSGRLLIPLARAGYQIVGLDNSPGMLALARQRLQSEPEEVRQRVTLIEADMTELDWPSRFAFIFVSYNTLMHLKTEQKGNLFKRARRHLRSGGLFFVDVINPLAAAQTPDDHFITLERCFVEPESGQIVVQKASSWPHPNHQILHIIWLFDSCPLDGGPVTRQVVQMDYHYLYPHELQVMLEETGFKLEALYGDYQQNLFVEESERLLLLARLPSSSE